MYYDERWNIKYLCAWDISEGGLLYLVPEIHLTVDVLGKVLVKCRYICVRSHRDIYKIRKLQTSASNIFAVTVNVTRYLLDFDFP